MLPVETVADILGLVYCVKHPVGVVLHRCRENNDLVHLSHLSEELLTAWSDAEASLAIDLVVVYQCFIKIEHQCVAVGVLGLW